MADPINNTVRYNLTKLSEAADLGDIFQYSVDVTGALWLQGLAIVIPIIFMVATMKKEVTMVQGVMVWFFSGLIISLILWAGFGLSVYFPIIYGTMIAIVGFFITVNKS